jgi:cytochrome c oxidase assembly protein subunit 15
MGWYMVKSGLVDLPRVSHFRLAAHLILAMFLMAYLYWLILDLLKVQVRSVSPGIQKLLYSAIVLFGLQVLYGAFVAGLRAGLGFNTFPLMDGQLLAEAATTMSPLLVNFLENGAMVQFVHRWIAVLLIVMSIVGLTMTAKNRGVATGWVILTALIAAQFVLGVSTLVMYVPIAVASLHQAGAVIVMLALVYLLYTSKTAENS